MNKLLIFSSILLVITACGKKELTEAEKAKMKQDSIEAREKTYDFVPEKVVGLGRIEPEQKIIKLYPETSGTVQQIFVKAGQEIKAGDLICLLSHDIEDAKIQKIEAQMKAQQVIVKTQDTQVRAQDEQVATQDIQVQSQDAQINAQDVQMRTQETQIRGFDKDIAKAQVAVELAQKNFNRISSLYNQGAETRVNYDNAENQLASSKAEVERLQAQKVNLQAQIDNIKAQQDIAKAQKRNLAAQKNNFVALKDNAAAQKNNLSVKMAELQADLAIAKAERAKKEIRALSDGKMLSVDIVVGSLLSASTSIGDFAPASALVVNAEMDELFAGKIELGQKAAIRLQGSSKEIATGKVTEVAAYLKQKSLFSDELGKLEDRRVREVKVRLDNPPKELLLGTRVDCIVYLK